MTLDDMTAKVRRLSRTGSTIVDAIVYDWINTAMRQFVSDVGGIVEVATGSLVSNFIAIPTGLYTLLSLTIGATKAIPSTVSILDDNEAVGVATKYFISGPKIHLDKTAGVPASTYKLVYEKFDDALIDGADAPTLPESAHMAFVYLAASKLSEENFEYDQAQRLYANYKNELSRIGINKANSNTSIFARPS